MDKFGRQKAFLGIIGFAFGLFLYPDAMAITIKNNCKLPLGADSTKFHIWNNLNPMHTQCNSWVTVKKGEQMTNIDASACLKYTAVIEPEGTITDVGSNVGKFTSNSDTMVCHDVGLICTCNKQ